MHIEVQCHNCEPMLCTRTCFPHAHDALQSPPNGCQCPVGTMKGVKSLKAGAPSSCRLLFCHSPLFIFPFPWNHAVHLTRPCCTCHSCTRGCSPHQACPDPPQTLPQQVRDVCQCLTPSAQWGTLVTDPQAMDDVLMWWHEYSMMYLHLVTKHWYCYRMTRSPEFRVQSLGLIQNFTEVKQDGGFLDIGFSSCTAPTFCHGLGISDVGLGFRSKVQR